MRFLARLLLTLMRLALLLGLVYGLLAVAWNDLLTRTDVFAITLGDRERPPQARCGVPGSALELIELPGMPGNLVVVAGGPQPGQRGGLARLAARPALVEEQRTPSALRRKLLPQFPTPWRSAAAHGCRLHGRRLLPLS